MAMSARFTTMAWGRFISTHTQDFTAILAWRLLITRKDASIQVKLSSTMKHGV